MSQYRLGNPIKETSSGSSYRLGNPINVEQEEEREEDRSGLIKSIAAFGLDLGISEGGRLGSAAAGAAIGSFVPGIGTAIGGGIGYVLGGLAFGAAGSRVRQTIDNPDRDVDQGQVFSDAIINLIPGGKAGKPLLRRLGAQAATGAGIGATAETAESVASTGTLPTLEELRNAGVSSAALATGLGLTGEAFGKAYTKFAGMPNRDLTIAYKKGDPDAKVLIDGEEKLVSDFLDERKKMYQNALLDIREKHDDEFIRLKELQNKVAGGQYKKKNAPLKVLTDESDYYMNRRMAEAAIEGHNNKIKQTIDLSIKDLQNLSKITGKSAKDISDEVDEYLYAKHAIAYNKANRFSFDGDGAAGISTDKAKSIISNFEKKQLNDTYSTVIDTRRQMSREILDTLEEGGLVSKKEANNLRTQFPDYVPLNRVMPEDDISDTANRLLKEANIKYETIAPGLRRAKGSELEVDNITVNIVRNLSLAKRRAEVNKANQAFVTLIENNKFLGTDTDKIVKIVPMKPTGYKKVKDDSPEAQLARSEGKNPPMKEIPIYKNDDQNVATVFKDGKRFALQFADSKLAQEFKGLNKAEVDGFLKASLMANRYLGGVFTRYNPEFMVPNNIRDRTEAFVNNLGKMKTTTAAQTLNPATLVRDFNVIRRNLFGVEGRNPKEKANDRLYQDFVQDGASTGNVGATTIKEIESTIEDLGKNLSKGYKGKGEKVNDVINKINSLFEDNTRFTTYRLARESGMTRKQSAFAARNSSFDPLQRGSQTGSLRALYLFLNPAIQGSKNFLRSTLKNKKNFAITFGGLMATTRALDWWNTSIDPEYRNKVPQWKQDKHLTFLTRSVPSSIPGGENDVEYVSVPIGYSMAPFKIAADHAQRFLFGDKSQMSPGEVASQLTEATLTAYNPLGGSINPTQVRPFNELAQNKNGLGQDIRPEFLERINMDPREKIYPHTANTLGGELAMGLADELANMGHKTSPENLEYLYQMYTGGPGKTVQRLFDVTAKKYNNEKTSPNDWPILRRFYGRTINDTFSKRTGLATSIEDAEYEQNTRNQKNRRIADQIFSKVKNAPEGETLRILKEELTGKEDVNESTILRVARDLDEYNRGVTRIDDKLKRIDPDLKAPIILKELEGKTDAEKVLYFKEALRKKTIQLDDIKELIKLSQ